MLLSSLCNDIIACFAYSHSYLLILCAILIFLSMSSNSLSWTLFNQIVKNLKMCVCVSECVCVYECHTFTSKSVSHGWNQSKQNRLLFFQITSPVWVETFVEKLHKRDSQKFAFKYQLLKQPVLVLEILLNWFHYVIW